MSYILLKSWLKRTYAWLIEAQEFLVCTLVIISALIFSLYIFPSENSIRIAGYVLQLLGMIFAVLGVLSIRVHFGHPSLSSLVENWLKRFPKWRNNIVIEVGSAKLKLKGGRARIEVWTPDNPESPIEERVSSIVQNLDRIRDELKSNYFDINGLKDQLGSINNEQEEARNKLEEKINKDFESFHTKDVLKSLVGLVWLTVGITLSTLPCEILVFTK